MCRLLTFVTLQWLLASIAAQELLQKSYNGDKLLAVEARDKRTWSTIIRILAYNEAVQDVDVWKEPDVVTGHAHIRIPARDLNGVIREFDRRNISHYILIDNIQRLIDGSRSENDTTIRTRRSEGSQSVVGRYARYDEILQWMDDVTKEHPDVASIISIGKSFEGRDTRLLKLGVPGKNKWRIWLDGGIHAREWISPATVVSIVHQLLRDYKTSDEGRTFLTEIDWYVLPVVNPDGYEYSHVTDRLWRKNRRPITKHCRGVDLNRNWNYHWGGYNAARDPCSNLFRGDRAASEPEVRNIIKFLLPRSDAFRAFVSLHNYYQLVTTRWAYDYNITPPDHEALLAVAQQMVAAMSDTHNMIYQAGSAPELLYPYAGGSGDWARGIANITYAYLVELRDKGQFGFLLPSSQIVPVGEEMWAGMKVIARQILTKHSNESVPEVIPDVTYRGNDVTTAESSTSGERTTRYGRVEKTTNRVPNPETTVRVTTRTATTRRYITRRVTTNGYTTRRIRVESTTPRAVSQTKTQLVSYGPTSSLVARGIVSSTTSDVRHADQTPSSQELVKTSTASGQGTWTQTLSSGQSSFTQSSRPTNRTQRVDRRDGNALARDIHPTPIINGSCRTRCHVIPSMLVGFCVCLGAMLTKRS